MSEGEKVSKEGAIELLILAFSEQLDEVVHLRNCGAGAGISWAVFREMTSVLRELDLADLNLYYEKMSELMPERTSRDSEKFDGRYTQKELNARRSYIRKLHQELSSRAA